VVAVYRRGAQLPDENDEEYISERYLKPRILSSNVGENAQDVDFTTNIRSNNTITSMIDIVQKRKNRAASALSEIELEQSSLLNDEYIGLMSQVDDLNESGVVKPNLNSISESGQT
jgi:hypothetical protein